MTSACPACIASSDASASTPASNISNIVLSLPTIRCAACIGKIETALMAIPGVIDARVNLSLKRVRVRSSVPDAELVSKIERLGYEAHPLQTEKLDNMTDNVANDLLMRLAVAGFAMMNVMLFSVAVWSGASDATRDLFHLLSASIAIPVVAYSAQPFFRNAAAALKVRTLNMDVPISLAIILAAGMSLYEALHSGRHAYFDAALSLTFFLLIGRYLDHRTRGAARSAAKELAALEAHTAERIRGQSIETVSIHELRVGDQLLIPTGVRVPVDGVLNSKTALTDRSFVTGESAAVAHVKGQNVVAGEVNLAAPFQMLASKVGDDTTLKRVAALVDAAENAKNRYTALADRAAQVYAPAVHILALVSFAGWVAWDGDVRHALNVAIAVLIITCPCALGLAVPAVTSAAISKLYQLGFLVKSGTALERLAEVDTFVFDKTGTLTIPGGTSDLKDLSTEQKSVAAALAQCSAHPISRAIAGSLRDTAPAKLDCVDEVPGKGVEGRWNGVVVQLGKAAWVKAPFEGMALRVGEFCVPIVTDEILRPGSEEAVRKLKDQGMQTIVLSGDKTSAVKQLGQRMDFDQIASQVDAEQKHEFIEDLATRDRRCAMVGDGLNDAASLAAAHASMAPSSALDASRNAADIVILRESFEDLPKLVSVARKAVALSRQNFAIAAAYNAIAIPIAIAGLATPLLAALAMSASSITVLVNALRVRRIA